MQTPASNGETAHRLPNGRFGPGNPYGGRRPSSRQRLAEAFLKDMHALWESHGKAALLTMIADDPGGFVRAAASLVPKEAKLQVEDMRTLVVSLVGAQMDEPDAIEGEAVPLVEEQPADDTEPLRAPDGYAQRS